MDSQVFAEERLIQSVAKVYDRWGFRRLDTPALEFSDALGKHLPDQDRPNAGVFSLQDDDEQWMSLRYDLTAPLARFVAENWQGLPKPFRRWQVGSVWRNEKPGPGRFRQFTQCDADSVGAPGPAADAEIIMIAAEALEEIGVSRGEYCVKINTRRALNGLLDTVSERSKTDLSNAKLAVLRAIDKLDRLGMEGVTELLGQGRKDESGDFTPGAGLTPEAIDAVITFLQAGKGDRGDTVVALEAILGGTSEGRAGLEELRAIDAVLDRCAFDTTRAAFDPAIVRGLDYYTGPVFEAHLQMASKGGSAVTLGSVGGGGRYDDLVARFRGEAVPATGFSIGVSRLVAALETLGRPLDAEAIGPVIVIVFDKTQMDDYFGLAAQLRNSGVSAEVYLGEAGIKAQMKYADRRNAPLAVLYGEDEKAKGVVTLKNLREGAKAAAHVSDNQAWREERPGQFEASVEELGPVAAALIEQLS